MAELQLLSKIEQVAGFLRGELESGRWEEAIPGRLELATEFGLNARTVEEALRLLEREGVLVPQGAGRRRKIALQKSAQPKRLVIGCLMFDVLDHNLPYHVDLVHRLEDGGHGVVIAERTMVELGMEVQRVARAVKHMQVDAWIVQGGSREILEWLAGTGVPVMAVFGRFAGLPIAAAGVNKIPALQKAVRRLHELGHQRMVLMVKEERRKPFPGGLEQAFLDELQVMGMKTGPYHLPDWENSISGFHRCLDSLFQHTPPTAMILSEATLFVAAQQHLARMGLVAPRDVSLVCDDPDTAFSWCEPPVSHISWESRPLVSRMVRWADRVARGVADKRQRFTKAEFVEGGTIGPVAK